jgi:hypothetical protein
MNVAEIVNNTVVQPELMGEAMTLIAELPAEDRRSFEGRSIALIQMLDVEIADRSHVSMSITFRLEAMARLENTSDMSAWVASETSSRESLFESESVPFAPLP